MFLCKNKIDTYAHLHMESVRLFQCSMIRIQDPTKYVNITQRNKYLRR